MMCAVCLAEVGADSGVIDAHATPTGAICPMSGHEPFVWDERATRAAVKGRAGGRCEYCGQAGTDMHHRVARGRGGAWSPANIMLLCRHDHSYFTDHPVLAYRLGISVRNNRDPAQVAVLTKFGQLWLSDDVAPPLPGWAR